MQKKTLPIMLTILFLAIMLTLMSTSTVAANPLPKVDTDKPIYPYWKVGGNVTIFGSGYNASKVYGVVITYPGASPTLFSVFTKVTAFEYIHPLVSPYPAGTYLVEIYEHPLIGLPVFVVSCHFGVWGIDPPVYNRGENITIQGGGVNPLSTVAIDIYYDEDGDLETTGDQTQMDVPAYWGTITDPTADPKGEFTKVVDIPSDAWVSEDIDAIYFVEITYDSYDGDGTTETGLTDTQTFEVSATYTVTISGLPAEVMNRGEDVTFTVTVTDASGDPVVGATVEFNDPKGGTVATGITDNGDGTYSVTYTIADDDPVGTWTITATATKDGNTGSSPGTDTVEISATYTISWYDPTSAVIKNRGHTQDFAFYVTDASGDPVEGLTTLYLDIDGDLATTDDQDSISLTSVGPGNYTGSWIVPSDAPTGDYDCVVTKDGNRGETPDYVTVSNLILVDVYTPKVVYGGLETLVIDALIDYEDGTNFTDSDGTATADVWIDANGNGEIDAGEFVLVTGLSLNYNSTNDVWSRTYDLYPPGAIKGTYTIKVTASDASGNSGKGTETFEVIPETMKDPTHGPVGTEVDIWGSGFAPDTSVSIMWNMSITEDFVGMGDGVTTEFGLVLAGLGYVKPGTETIYLNGVLATDYTIDYATGVVTFDTAPGYGVVITADYELLIPLAWTMTNEYGSFTATFTVPESYACEHVVIAVDGMNNVATDIFCVEPQIVLSSTKGPPEAWITVTGTGFAPNTEVDIYVEYWYEGMWHLVGEGSWVLAVTDTYGTFSQAILLPSLSLQAMYNELGIAYGVYMICAEDYSIDENYAEDYYLAVLFCEPSVIDVKVKTGALYFPSEVFTVYALTSVDGVPMDVHNITFSLYYETLGPIPLSQYLPVVHVDTGLYAVTTTLPPDIDPGNYLIVVTATKSCWIEFGWVVIEPYYYEDYLEWEVTINGVGMDGFIISPTLMDMNAMLIGIKGDIATINTNIGLIQLDLTAINAKLSSIQGSIATIETNIGTIQTDISTINGAISSIQGNIVTITSDLGTITTDIADINGHLASIDGSIITIQTDIGAIKTDISSINGHIATIEGDIVTIETDIGTIKTDISAIDGRLTSIEDGVAIIQTAIGDIEVKLDETVIPFLEAIEAKLDVMGSDVIVIKTAIGDVETKLDDTVIPLLQAVNATIVSFEEKVDGYYLALNTTIGEIVLKVDPGVFVYLEAIEAKLDAIGPGVVRMESTLGDIEFKLDDIGDFLIDINATLTSIEGRLATIETDIGTIQVDIASIDTSITSIEGNIVTITTKLGTIEGKITTIEGDIATIKTDIGEIQVDLPPLKETSSAIQSTTTLGMSIGSVLSAVAAIAAVAACILIFRRLKVAS